MAESEHIDLEVKGLSLIDDALESDDFVLTLSPSPLKPTDNHKGLSSELSGTVDVQEEKDMDNKGNECDMLPELRVPMEPEKNRRKRILNLRKSLAWDSAFFTDAGLISDNHKDLSSELSRTMNVQEEKDMEDKGNQCDMLSELHVPMEPGKNKRKGILNLRKSLAWDSAFFTDAGVLDPDELSSMVKGAEKTEKGLLPMIDEDVDKSTDTISTLESDDVPLEHVEAELFVDIRASIQKSNKISNAMISARKEASSEADPASKKADTTLRNVPRPKLPPKRTTGMQVLGLPKSQQKPTEGIQGSRKGSVIKSGDSTSSLAKLPKMISKANPISTPMTKRASLSANQSKTDHENMKTNTVAGKGVQTSKVFDSSNACKVLPKPALSSKSSSMKFSGATKMQPSRSSSESTGSTLSDKAGKPTLPVARRKVAMKPVSQPSSSSTLKTPSKTSLKNKVSSGNSAISAYIMSSKINSSISPASSISEWSSVSATSSSCSNINDRSNKSRNSFDTSSCRSLESVVTSSLDTANWSSSQISEKSNPEIASPKENARKPSTKSDTFFHPPSKPSCLRMPSPKIGFFDGGKSARTPNGAMHGVSKQSTAMPKIGATLCSPSQRSNTKSKTSDLPPARVMSTPVNVKFSGTQNLPSPVSFQDKSHASLNTTDAPTDKQCFPSFAPEVHHKQSEETTNAGDGGVTDAQVFPSFAPEVHHKQNEETTVAGDGGVTDVLESVNHGGLLGILKNEMSANINEKANLNGTKVVAAEEETCISFPKNTDTISGLAACRIPLAVRNSGNNASLDFSTEALIREALSPPH